MKSSRKLFAALAATLPFTACVSSVLAQGETQPADETPGIGSLVWTFLNSPLGISLVSMALIVLVGKILAKKPAWKVYADKYRPLIIAAIKQAEKAIPDDTPNASMKRLDSALKYVLMLNARLDSGILSQAITALHAEAEASGNV